MQGFLILYTLVSDTSSSSDSKGSDGRPPHYQQLHIATIAGVVVGAVGLLVMFVSVCFIIRWKKLRRRPFHLWTIQLRADDDRVNFSQMVDTDEDGRQLFEKDHQPAAHRSSKSNIYRAVRT